MVNGLENGASHGNQAGEIGNPVDYRAKLITFLPQLPKSDANFLKEVMRYKFGAPSLYQDLVNLLEPNWERAQQKIRERRSAKRVDMMNLLSPFSPMEKVIITRNLRSIQMTDGCTVGCFGCGGMTRRGVKQSFSDDSSMELMTGKYGRNFSKNKSLILYSNSDPFDWVSEDGEHGHDDLVSAFLENKNNGRIYISTAVPEGAELSIIKSLIYFFDRGEEKLRGVKGQRSIRKALDIRFRFSQTEANKERIDKILEILRDLNFSEEQIKAIRIVVREGKMGRRGKLITKEPFRKIGYFARSLNREEDGQDMQGIECKDALVMTPAGIFAESMEAVTSVNQRGVRSVELTPGFLEIPVHRGSEDYDKSSKNLFSLLPKHEFKVYKNGKYVGIKTVESVGRDALAFYYALGNLEEMANWYASKRGRALYEKKPELIPVVRDLIRKKFIPEYGERKMSCMNLFSQEKDEQAVRVAGKLINKIDDWLEHMNEKLGLSEAGTLL